MLRTCSLNVQSNAINEVGALYISSHANFKSCGSDYSGSNNISFDGGALPLNMASAFDAECSTDNELSFNNSITFLRNTAEHSGGSIECGIASTIAFIGTVYFNESYESAIEGDSCNMTFIGTTYFYRNSAFDGGAIRSYDSNITFSGLAYFEGNVAIYYGGAIALRASKIILKPNLNILFISNYAEKIGGALYVKDSQCSLGSSVPIECFITIDGPPTSTSNISLHFENNSAGTTGSILYGGQLDQCRLYFKSTTTNSYKEPDLCDCQTHGYSDKALKIFINMSNITQIEVPDISSTAKEIKFCEDRIPEELDLYPGQQFTIPLIAHGQANSPVPATVFWETINKHGEYRLSPSSSKINDLCTNVSFWLYSSDLNLHSLDFKLYPENLCQNLIGLTFSVHVLPCPVGFNLSRGDSKCVCGMALKQLGIHSCYIDSNSESVERLKNNFWISKQSNEILILHKFPCPLDYCMTKLLNVTLSDPSVQCDFHRTGIVCGQCKKTFSLALGSLHCSPCYNIHITLIVPFALTGIASGYYFSSSTNYISWNTEWPLLLCKYHPSKPTGFLPQSYYFSSSTNYISWNTEWPLLLCKYHPSKPTGFLPQSKNQFLFLNLDVGIETCFFMVKSRRWN
jgi:predicted outer membrane repeat protein